MHHLQHIAIKAPELLRLMWTYIKFCVPMYICCDTFMSAISRWSNSWRVAKAEEKDRRDRKGWIREGKNLPIISIVTVRSTFSSRHEKPFCSTLASRYCEFIHDKGIRNAGKEKHVRKYDILLQRKRLFECPREIWNKIFELAKKREL